MSDFEFKIAQVLYASKKGDYKTKLFDSNNILIP